MPTYDFRCLQCSHRFEVILPFGNKRHPLCPNCGNAKTEKLIAPPTIHFKGTGFFKTDSRKAAEPNTPQPTETKPEKKDSTPPATKSDGKIGKTPAKD